MVSSEGGIANTVGLPQERQRRKSHGSSPPAPLPQSKELPLRAPHFLVPAEGILTVKSSDPVLHTVHMSGSADYNLPFVSAGQEISRPMMREGMVDLRCNAGHVG